MIDFNERIDNLTNLITELTIIHNNNLLLCLQKEVSELKCLQKNPLLSYSKIKLEKLTKSSIPSIRSNILFLQTYCKNSYTQIPYNTCINLSNAKISQSINHIVKELEIIH